MTQRMSFEETTGPRTPPDATGHHIRFVEQSSDGQAAFMEFVDPGPAWAVRVAAAPEAGPDGAAGPDGRDDALEVRTVPGRPGDHPGAADELAAWVLEAHQPGTAAPITVTLHNTQVVWHRARAAVLAPPERMEALLLAVVEFGFYERELGRLERTVAESWPQLEADTPLAFEVTAGDADRLEGVGRQARRMLAARMKHARLAPRLQRPGAHLSSLANQLGERLREHARVEDRLEHLAGQLEVFDRVYELSSQRASEFRIARQEKTLEWVIIVLLAAETLLLFIEVLLTLDRR
jgi:hypothetical protein